MTLQTAADIVGGNAKVALGAANLKARVIKITATGGNARFGDVNVAATRGAAIVQNVPFTFDQNGADPTDWLDLSTTYVYVPSGTTLTLTWGI